MVVLFVVTEFRLFIFYTGESVSHCQEILESFGETTLLPIYNHWRFVDFEKRDNIDADLVKQGKSVRSKSSRMVSDDVVTAPDMLPTQKLKPIQRPRIDVDKTSIAGRSILFSRSKMNRNVIF